MSASVGLGSLTTTTEGARPGYRWNRRWFVLEDNILHYYSEQGATECKQRIPLTGAVVEHVTKSASTPGYVFQIKTREGQTLRMMAGSEGEAKMWVDAIQAGNKGSKSDVEPLTGEGKEIDWPGASAQTFEQHLSELKDAATTVTKLKTTGGDFTGTPMPSISILHNLKELVISENKLSELPPSIGQLKHLELLDASDNLLSELSVAVCGVGSTLQTLHLYKNSMTKLPSELGQLVGLTDLNLFNNKLLRLPAEINQPTALLELNLSSNKFMMLPEIDKLVNLKRLAIFWCRVMKMPSLATLTSLENLELYRNNLEAIEFGSHPNLKAIMLANNNFATLPDSMSSLPAVEELDLSKNKFEEFPLPICKITSLEKVVLGSNQLSSLPKEMGALENLVSLDVSANQIQSGDYGFLGGFQSLTNLFLANNQLTTLPSELKNLGKLKRVTLQGNSLDLSDTVTQEVHTHCQDTCGANKGRFQA